MELDNQTNTPWEFVPLPLNGDLVDLLEHLREWTATDDAIEITRVTRNAINLFTQLDNPPTDGERDGYRDVVVPGIVLRNYRDLGLSDSEVAWVIHLLAQSGEGLLLSDIQCRANRDTQNRYARHLRELGLLFTCRRYSKGRCAGQMYDLSSLVHNCERLNSWRKDDHPLDEFSIELPPEVGAHLRAGEYDDVPSPWDRLAQEQEQDEERPRGTLARPLALLLPGNGARPDRKRRPGDSSIHQSRPHSKGGGFTMDTLSNDVIDQLNKFLPVRESPPLDTTPQDLVQWLNGEARRGPIVEATVWSPDSVFNVFGDPTWRVRWGMELTTLWPGDDEPVGVSNVIRFWVRKTNHAKVRGECVVYPEVADYFKSLWARMLHEFGADEVRSPMDGERGAGRKRKGAPLLEERPDVEERREKARKYQESVAKGTPKEIAAKFVGHSRRTLEAWVKRLL